MRGHYIARRAAQWKIEMEPAPLFATQTGEAKDS